MTKREIFQTILDIVKTDASFCKDKAHFDGKAFLEKIDNEISDLDFLYLVDSYLCQYKVSGHLSFYKKGFHPYVGFNVRRYGNLLYVIQAQPQSGLFAGDIIKCIDGVNIEQATEKYSVFLYDEAAERQGQYWDYIFRHVKNVTLERYGKELIVSIKQDCSRPEYIPYEFKELNNNTVYMRFDDFADEAAIAKLIAINKDKILQSKNLIIDVRDNCGGTDTAWTPLLKYCINENDKMCGTAEIGGQMEMNYTVRNSDLRLNVLREYRKTALPQTIQHFDEAIKDIENNRGKGFVRVQDDEPFIYPAGTTLPEKVFILTDCTCASSGEAFVMTAAKCSKVTVVGRPTMGILDYSNLACCELGDYVLNYPTSRDLAVDTGEGINGKGAPVDVYIPWSPEHLNEDIDLTAVLKLL